MERINGRLRNLVARTAIVTASSLLAWTAAIPALADPADPVNPLQKRFTTGKPLSICDEGAFFVGGVPKVPSFGVPRQVIIGHMYVQFQIPTKRRQWPVIATRIFRASVAAEGLGAPAAGRPDGGASDDAEPRSRRPRAAAKAAAGQSASGTKYCCLMRSCTAFDWA
jgi:hypothetical protein